MMLISGILVSGLRLTMMDVILLERISGSRRSLMYKNRCPLVWIIIHPLGLVYELCVDVVMWLVILAI
jgi:hypothetical protein